MEGVRAMVRVNGLNERVRRNQRLETIHSLMLESIMLPGQTMSHTVVDPCRDTGDNAHACRRL